MKTRFFLTFFLALTITGLKAQYRTTTYCNPINIDYSYTFHNSNLGVSYRSGADPAVVEFRGEYYMFVTRSYGYWHSMDMSSWEFITPEHWYFEGENAPAAFNYKDSVLYVTGNPSEAGSILYTDNPKKGDWKPVASVLHGFNDPAFFIDDDGKAYMYYGSSNKYPIRVKELDKSNRFNPTTNKVIELFNLDPQKHGWERFGQNHTDTITKPFIEGSWMNKHNGKYYLQYAAPGTELNVYADGVYIGDGPLGPYHYAPNNPISYKPGGFMNGAGHGSTVEGPDGLFWHFASMSLSINYKYERRLCMFPTFFDNDGLMYCNTNFGDYPHFSPDQPYKQGEFTGWMLLSYHKKVTASSQLKDFPATHINDENIQTWWVADQNNDKQWLSIDLQSPSTVYAIQINYHDYKENKFYGRMPGIYYRYQIEGSNDGKHWQVIVDKSNNYKDIPNDYVELDVPVKTRFIRFKNIHVPNQYLAISEIRVFGKGLGKIPAEVKNFKVERQPDQRNASLNWEKQKDAQGYNIRWGIAADKLYSSWLVYDTNKLYLRCLNTGQKYFFSIESFNENGVSKVSKVIEVK